MKTPQSKDWQAAIDSELKGLEDTACYDECKLPPDQKAIFAQWVLTVKTDSLGNIIKYKARCTCRGDMISSKLNTDISSPVASWTGIRLFLALTTIYDLKPLQLDINLAYLNAPLEEEVYMYPPPGSKKPTWTGMETPEEPIWSSSKRTKLEQTLCEHPLQ
jgi:hypothetical protein